ncbi:hypothetical protein EMGBS15_16760 [Filimonas sp.]|nr:hypothetical protein EMGBS15_16760 [Filimonas sp.]
MGWYKLVKRFGRYGSSIVTSMVVYNNKLIVGGYFTDADGTPANYIASHDGNNWAALGAGLGGGQGQVMTLDIYNNQLIAGGFFTSAGGSTANHIAKWNGTSWSTLGSGISGIVYSLTKYNGSLIAGGLFLGAGGSSANHIASWNGSSWSALGSGMSGTFYQYVLALTTFNGNLIAGGYFTHSNGIITNGIAQWNGSVWSAISGGLWYPANVYGAHTFCQYGQDLVVGGLFTNAGGINTSHIAKMNFITPGVSLNLKLYLEGYYTGAGLMTATLSNQGIGTNQTITDSIDVDLYDTSLSYIETTKTVLNTNGTASCSFVYALPGNYYVVIRQRNCIETWSALPIFLTAIPSTYDFTNASAKAYGNNMKELAPATWGLYSGELNADGNIDLLDNIDLEYSIFNFDSGYVPTDINGDGNVDLLDTPIMENNINNFVFSNHP